MLTIFQGSNFASHCQKKLRKGTPLVCSQPMFSVLVVLVSGGGGIWPSNKTDLIFGLHRITIHLRLAFLKRLGTKTKDTFNSETTHEKMTKKNTDMTKTKQKANG